MAEPIRPVYSEVLPDGRMLWGLTEHDMGRVRAGYACGSCLEPFEIYMAACPICGCETRADLHIVAEPAHWKPSPPNQDIRPVTSIDDLVDTDTALGEIGRWYRKKRR